VSAVANPTTAIGAPIRIEALTKHYDGFKAVDDVSLDVAPGEFVTILGASGSGKTTTLMAVAGFVKPNSGTIRIGDRDISQLPPEKRGLGVVFQSYALFPLYDVFENIAFPLRLRRFSAADIRAKVGHALDLVDLAPLAKRRIAALSGGQQQRVALARAIVFSPPVLLMDEPLGALDRKLREQLQGEIKRIQRDLGVTVLYVTHDQEEALAMSDRLAIMRQGRIAQLGPPDEVYARPASPFTARFLGESNFVPVRRVGSDGERILVETEGASRQGFAAVAGPAGLPEGAIIGMIRPEAVRIGAAAPVGMTMPATIERCEHLGPTVRLTLVTAIGPLIARLSRTDCPQYLAPGTEVVAGWRADDMILYARGDEEDASRW
jgi:ABC-type Fe3+/spermidine/putrescine transport system ATPase subunit